MPLHIVEVEQGGRFEGLVARGVFDQNGDPVDATQAWQLNLGLFASAFNPLHPGHLWAIKQALEAGACDRVIAAVQDDPTTDRPDKRPPIWPVAHRAAMLEAVPGVECVVVYRTEADLLDWIQLLHPAVLIVGEDHREDPVTGADLVPVFWAKRRPTWSSSRFVDDIWRHGQLVIADRGRQAEEAMRRDVQQWVDAKCPCPFPAWDGTQQGGNEATMQEFGQSQGGAFLIETFGARDAEQTSESVPGQGDPEVDRGVQSEGVPGVR